MNRELVYLADGSRVELARDQILAFGITAVPVLDDEGRPVGFVSLRDVVGGNRRVSAPVVTVRASASIGEAARSLAATDFHHVVVVDAKGCAVGMVSSLDLLRALVGLPPRHPKPIEQFGKPTVSTP